jgi:hypothetical protein
MPREARWSRPSSIILSILVHVALFLAVRHLIWRPLHEADGPVFQIFQLSTTKESTPPITAPVLPPPVAKTQEKAEEKTEEKREEPRVPEASPPPAEGAPALAEPSVVPSTLPPPGAAVTEPTGNAGAGPPRTAAERILRSGVRPVPDATSASALPMPVTPQEAAAARLANGYKAINDSIAAAIAAENGATDWTKTDSKGNKWGVTPGQLHLGSITLPMPFYFHAPPGRRDDAAKSARIFAESNAQAKRMEMEETFESRVKAMRKRKDAQRDSARAAQKKTGH